ncbi:alpha-2-macroglobulin-like protein 1 [Rhinoderma darwinii]|uniref:alpha-2-macroglobulin-like protein 1 n=1 Tax=Rhinoderma darwinii TaxID=43563 RepID=UPI003F676607
MLLVFVHSHKKVGEYCSKMRLFLLSICVSICFFLEKASASEPYYAITVPAQMIYPSEERACITILKLNGELQLKMELKREQKSVLVAEDTIKTPKYFQCYSFELPTVVEKEEVWFFHVSAHGDTMNINQTKKIMLTRGSDMTFIQTDKPNYKPGQTVNFRIISLDRNFHAKNDKYPVVELIDPNNNQIGQWLDVSPHQGIADLSFPLANELPLGDYIINIPNRYKTLFSVSEYVLKTFSLNIDVPRWVTAMDKSFNVKVCGSYTYGKPVSGSIELTICNERVQSFYFYSLDLDEEDSGNKNMDNCQQITGMQTDDKGCLSREIDLAFFNVSSPHMLLKIKALLTEDVSGYTAKASAVTSIASNLKMLFEEIPDFYQKGIPFNAKLKVNDEKSQPKVNETVHLVLGFEEEDLNLTSVTNEEGIAVFTVNTSTWDDMVSVLGKFSLEDKEEDYSKLSYAFVWLHPLYSESNSYLRIEANTSKLSCDSDQYLTVQYFINTSQLDPTDRQLNFFYFYVSKGIILSHGEYGLDIKEQSPGSVLQGNFKLKIPIGIEFYPNFIFVVHTILDNGDIPSYTKEFTTPACLKNKIELKFSKEKVRPGEKVNLEVRADSGSLCSVRSVDKGLLLHREHETFHTSELMLQIMSLTLAVNKRGFPYSIEDFEKYPCLRNKKEPQAGIQEAAWYHGDADVYMMLKQSNLKIFTNTKIRKPVMCASPSFTRRISNQPHKTVELPSSPNSKSQEAKKKAVKRTFFPETWLYDLVSVGPQGQTLLNLTTPHSITTWETDAFCLGMSGFGETSGVGLTTFQPYFIELILPYSVVQGEKFTITAHVFSYLRACLMIFVSLSDLRDYPTVGNKEQSQCMCEDQSASFIWNVSASKPGDIKVHVSSTSLQLEGGCTDQIQTFGKDQNEDNVEKTILVKPSGILEENTQTFLLCPSGDSVRRTVMLEVPEKVVPGSDQALVTVLGNIMGSAISNIGQSLTLPFGSGEQNLVNFIPISYIVKYLESTKKLTPKIKETAASYLIKGYVSQVMFKKDDGSYSVYHGIPGSTWLTAFTVRSFSHVQDLIYIQEKHIDDAVKWLSSLQLPSGCFKEVGKIFNNYLMREADDNVTLTAYITIALLEHGQVYNVSVVENALKCLRNAVDDVRTTYTQALLAYVFTLSSDSDLRKRVLEILERAAIRKDGSKHWAADEKDNGDVEISSYVLLALLSDQTSSHREVEEASPIVNWIIKRQRPQGGFRSTQDTVVALQALTKYAKAIYTDDPDVTVSVRSLSGFNRQFHVDKKNSLLTQREILPDIPGEYTLTATGTGCAFIQTHLKFHTPLAKSDAYFILTASTQPSVCSQEAKAGLDILVEASYSGERTITNTVIIEVQLLSGFLPNKRSVKKLKNNPIVERTEITPDKVIIYLAKLTHAAESLRFSIKKALYVNNLQAAKVTIYDYYAPDEHAVTDYNSPCSTEKEKDV